MGIKVCKELDKRYADACALCAEKHFKIYGEEPDGCAFRNIDGEYCTDIETAERLRQERDHINDHMDKYLSCLEADDGSAYVFIGLHSQEFTHEELIAIIKAFDCMIYPGLNTKLTPAETKDAYSNVCRYVRNEIQRGHSENNPR